MKPTSQAVFDAAAQFVAKWEGGFFDHPSDPGGVTNYGISMMFLKGLGLLEGDVNGDGVVDRLDVLAITPESARMFFKRYFWDATRCYELPPLVCVAFYDLAVNAGPGRAAIVLQQAINATMGRTVITNYAANLGPLTRRFSNELAESGQQLNLCKAYLDAREAWYRRLAAAKPSSQVFLKGWLNRTNDMRDYYPRLAVDWGITA